MTIICHEFFFYSIAEILRALRLALDQMTSLFGVHCLWASRAQDPKSKISLKFCKLFQVVQVQSRENAKITYARDLSDTYNEAEIKTD